MNSSKLAELERAIAVIDDRAANTEMLLEPYRNERDELAQRLANATLQDDALQLAAAQIRKQLLDTEIARLEGDGRRDAFQRSELASLLADEENKRDFARNLLADLRADGLTHPRFHSMDVSELLNHLVRARATLAELGEPAGPITVEL